MQFLLVPVSLYLFLYAPGHYLLAPRRGDEASAGSLLFREVVLSAACTSWVGFALAELGLLSAFALLSGLTALALLARWGRKPTWRYRLADLMGLAVLALTWVWVAPPLDTRLLGADSTGYLASGVHLARHGTLVIHDPTLLRLSPDLKRLLLPSVAPDRGSPPYLRLLGSLVARSLDTDEVLPAFHHLIAVWIAAFHNIAGGGAGEWVVTLFAGLSVWAFVECAALLGGSVAAAVCFVLLLSLAPQYWYARFLMPEVPGQFFLWSGVSCLGLWQATRRRSDAVLAGLAFGFAGMMRTENAAFVLVAAVLTYAVATSTQRRPFWPVLATAAVVWLHAFVHLLVFRTHYLGNLATFLSHRVPALLRLGGRATLLLVAAAVIVSLYGRTAKTAGSLRDILRLGGLAAVAGIGLWGDFNRGWASLDLMRAYAGFPTLLLGAVGLGWSASRLTGRNVVAMLMLTLVCVVFAQVTLEPHATPVAIWLVRRAVPIVMPGLCLGVALLCSDLAARRHLTLAVAATVLAIGGQATALRTLQREPYYLGAGRHVEAISALIPSGACVLYDGSLVAMELAPMLWAERDLPAYLLSSDDSQTIHDVATSLAGMPLYWINSGASAPPDIQGMNATAVARYEFVLATPGLDLNAAPGAMANWELSFGVYELRPK